MQAALPSRKQSELDFESSSVISKGLSGSDGGLPFLTWEQKWWYFKAMRQVLGCIFGALASSTQPLLSSKMVEWATVEPTINFVVVLSSWRRPHIGMRSWADWERAMYSASVVLKAISVSLFEHHRTGQEAKVITCKVWQKKDPQK